MHCCIHCGQTTPEEAMTRTRQGNVGNVCKGCRAAQKKALRTSPEGAVRQREYSRHYRERNRERERWRSLRYHYEHREERSRNSTERGRTKKGRARQALKNAVAAGNVVKPAHCQDCGARTLLQGHHHDYNKPFDVEWLCSQCHGLRHRKGEEDAA
jgi:hypothetical protein